MNSCPVKTRWGWRQTAVGFWELGDPMSFVNHPSCYRANGVCVTQMETHKAVWCCRYGQGDELCLSILPSALRSSSS
jgi:hypothetical protein